MTVMPSTPSRIMPLGNPDLTGGSTDTESANILFEALLKGFDKNLKFHEDGQSAIRPQIGQSAESFLAAALPATTALPLAAAIERVRDVMHQAREAIHQAPIADRAPQLLTRVTEALRAWTTPSAGGATSAPSFIAVAKPVPQTSIPQANLPLPSATPTPRIRQGAPPEGIKGLIASLRLPGQPNAARSPSPATSPLAAHLLDLDGQLRLVVKLPKLPEEQRLELESRLRQLLEEFGHHRPDLVIREAGRAARG